MFDWFRSSMCKVGFWFETPTFERVTIWWECIVFLSAQPLLWSYITKLGLWYEVEAEAEEVACAEESVEWSALMLTEISGEPKTCAGEPDDCVVLLLESAVLDLQNL